MDLRAVLTDLNGRALAFLDDQDLTIKVELLGPADVTVTLGRGSGLGSKFAVGRRAIQVYEDETLRFFGKVWEPLTIARDSITAKARTPLAEFLQRRAQSPVEYTDTNNGGGPWDAAELAYHRLAVQNARRHTYLREGTSQASVPRARIILPGTLESDVLMELASASAGFFFSEVPVAGVPGVMADLNITYPDAATERADVMFAHGAATLDNCSDYQVDYTLPRNLFTAAASAGTGGRIAKAARDADSIEEYGLFEDETTFSDVTDEDLLQGQADSNLRPEPGATLELTPGADAPLLFQDFEVGDFVRAHIDDPDNDYALRQWARVLSATLQKTAGGSIILTQVELELVVGGAVAVPVSRLWRKRQDETRRRLEALERRQQNTAETAVAAPEPPAASEPGGGGSTPDEPAPADPPPPPAPPEPPEITGLSATGMNVRTNGVLQRGVEVSISVDTKGQPCDVVIDVGGGVATLGGSGTVFIDKGPGTYAVNATARTTAGSAAASTNATVPPFTAE